MLVFKHNLHTWILVYEQSLCQRMEMYWFYWLSHLPWKLREFAVSSLFLPISTTLFCVCSSHPGLLPRILQWEGYVLQPMGSRLSSLSHSHAATVALFEWATTLLAQSAFVLNGPVAGPPLTLRMSTSAVVSFQEGQVLSSVILRAFVFPLFFRHKAPGSLSILKMMDGVDWSWIWMLIETLHWLQLLHESGSSPLYINIWPHWRTVTGGHPGFVLWDSQSIWLLKVNLVRTDSGVFV